MEKEFKYKLDFYYQQALIYLITLVIYVGLRSSMEENAMMLVLEDSLLYIIIFFCGLSLLLLGANRFRNKRLMMHDDRIVFQNRFMKKEILVSEIEWMHIGKERGVQTAGRYQVVLIKMINRRRAYRIRIGRYERDRELLKLMEQIAEKVPARKKRFSLKRKNKNV